MAKKKSKKKDHKQLKDKKKKILRKKELKKKALRKKDQKKKDQKKKEARKKELKEKTTQIPDAAKELQEKAAQTFTDHSSNYNVQDANAKLRSLRTLEEIDVFTKGEQRVSVTKNIPIVKRRLETA